MRSVGPQLSAVRGALTALSKRIMFGSQPAPAVSSTASAQAVSPLQQQPHAPTSIDDEFAAAQDRLEALLEAAAAEQAGAAGSDDNGVYMPCCWKWAGFHAHGVWGLQQVCLLRMWP